MDNESELDRDVADSSRLEQLAKAASVARLTTVNLAPEAAQVNQLTTFEVLTALNANIDREDSSSVQRIIVPDRARWWQRVRVRIKERYDTVFAFLYRNIPHGIKNNRLGIQWSCIGAVVMVFQFITPPDHPFLGPCWLSFANFIAINALTTIEMATGATNRNAGFRILGTTLAAIISFAVLIPMIKVGWEGEDDSYMVRWIMYYACTPSPFIWNFFLYHYPTYMHENFTFQGLSTQVYLFGSNSKKIVWDMSICTIGCYIGTVVGFIGYQLVVPLRARDKLTHDLSLIIYKLSYSLEPLIEFESGTKAQRTRHTVSKLPLFQKSLSKQTAWRANGSKGELATRGSRLIRSFSKKFKRSDPVPETQVDDVDKFRARVWDTLTDCAKLMEDHDEVLAHARREHYWSKPHFFYYNHFKRLSSDCRALYYHISSLFLVFQAQMSTTATQAVYNNLAKLPPAATEVAASGVDYGGLFQGSSFLNPNELVGSGQRLSTSISASPGTAASLPPLEREPAARLSINSPPSISPMNIPSSAPFLEDLCVIADTTADAEAPPEKFYTPFEALSACKIPKHDLVPKEEPDLVHQMTMPAMVRRRSSCRVITRAASEALIRQAYSSLTFDTGGTQNRSQGASDQPTETADQTTLRNSAPIDAEKAKLAELELRGALLEVAQDERADVMDSLAGVQNIMRGEDGSMVVPPNGFSASNLVPSPSSLAPPKSSNASFGPGSQRLDSGRVRVGGELDILVSAPSAMIEEAPIAPAKVIGLAPVIKWAAVFGPMFGEIAENMGHVLELIGESLDFFAWNSAVWTVIEDVDASLDRLVAGRRNWWQVSQEMASLINSNLYMKDCVADQGMYDELEEKFCIPWLGLTLDAYGRLPAAVKDDLWVSFENMQDRQTMAVKTCEVLTRRLRLFAQSAEAFLALQFPTSRIVTEPAAREKTARKQSVLTQ